MAPRARAGGSATFLFEVDLHGALPILTLATVPLAVHEVSAIAIYLTHRRLQVMHVAFHFAIDRIFGAVFTPSVLPALTLMTKLPGGDNVLPFNSTGAVFIFRTL